MFSIPLEYLMWAGIGFCLAWLTALIIMPAVHNRAVRLARERYDDLPLSMQEIRAEKDTIRAGFAAATRELEVRIEKLKGKTVVHATELAKKSQLIERLKQEIDSVTAALRDSETREQSARDELRETRRIFADKDVTLGTAEGEITTARREIASKDATLRATERDIAALRSALSEKESALHVAERQIASVSVRLRDSEAREQAANETLREARRGVADKDATLGTFEGEIEGLRRELAARDTALQAAERELAAMRAEVASKDAALTRAETEIAAIKAEIAALTPLILAAANDPGSARAVAVVPFVAGPRTLVAPHAKPQAAQPETQDQPARPQHAHADAPQPAQLRPTRPPLDVAPAPTRLVPSTIPPAQKPSGNGSKPVRSEALGVAPQTGEPTGGANQRLRALYAPLATTSG